jgi:hypothetical protein
MLLVAEVGVLKLGPEQTASPPLPEHQQQHLLNMLPLS